MLDWPSFKRVMTNRSAMQSETVSPAVVAGRGRLELIPVDQSDARFVGRSS